MDQGCTCRSVSCWLLFSVEPECCFRVRKFLSFNLNVEMGVELYINMANFPKAVEGCWGRGLLDDVKWKN